MGRGVGESKRKIEHEGKRTGESERVNLGEGKKVRSLESGQCFIDTFPRHFPSQLIRR